MRSVPPSVETVTALLYSRVSSDEQADEGVSLAAQVSECRRYAKRQGWRFGDEMQDILTGRRDDRPGYQRLLLTVRGLALEGKPAAVVVASLDRLGRNVAERVRAYEELKRLGVPIHSAREGGIVSEFTYNILAAVAQEESRKLGERVRGSNKHFVEKGWRRVGRVAWGYRWRDATPQERAESAPLRVLELHPDEAPAVREAWARLATGASMQSVARWAAELPDAARGGRNLAFAAIRKLFLSPVYVARFDEGADDVLARPQGRWDALISDETWQAAQDSLTLARKMPRQASGAFPLTGLIRCHKCGSRMAGRTNRTKWSPKRRDETREYAVREYACCAWAEGAEKAGARCYATVPARAVERAVLGTVREMLTAVNRPKVRERARRAWAEREQSARADDVAVRIADLERQHERAERRIADASTRFLDGEISRTAYDITSAKLMADLEAIKAELSRLRGRAKPATLPPLGAVLAGVTGWATALRNAAPEATREALGVLVERAEPVRVGFGKYEAHIKWTPVGWALLGAALQIAPSDNLMSVEYLGQP